MKLYYGALSIILFVFILITACSTEELSIADNYQKVETLGTFYPPVMNEELSNKIKTGEVSFILARFKRLDHSILEDLPYLPTYRVDENVLLIKIDEGTNLSRIPNLEEIGLLDYKVKYNQNVEFITSHLESRQVGGILHFYAGTDPNLITRKLGELGIEYSKIPNYRKESVAVKLKSKDEIDILLQINQVKHLLFNKIIDDNIENISSGNYPKIYHCEGTYSFYGVKLPYLANINSGGKSTQKFVRITPSNVGGGGFHHSNYPLNDDDDCIHVVYHTDKGNGRDIDGNQHKNDGDFTCQNDMKHKKYWDDRFTPVLESAFAQWRASNAGIRFTHGNPANGYNTTPPVTTTPSQMHFVFDERGRTPNFGWANSSSSTLAFTIPPDISPLIWTAYQGSTHVYYDADKEWTENFQFQTGAPYHFETVTLHEIGHAIGLAHENDVTVFIGNPISIMHEDYNMNVGQIIQTDDFNGIGDIYDSDNCCTNCYPGFTYDGSNCYSGLHYPNGWTPFVYQGSFYVNDQNGDCPPGFTYDGANCYSGKHFDPNEVSPFFYNNGMYTTAYCN